MTKIDDDGARRIMLELMFEQLTRPDAVRGIAIERCTPGDDLADTIDNFAHLTQKLCEQVAWLLTVAGGQNTAGALKILHETDLWSQIDEIGRDMGTISD